MPYISQQRRRELCNAEIEHLGKHARTAGELTFLLTYAVHNYLHASGNPDFAKYAEALGALETTKLELYRRDIARYEDAAIIRNGDV